MLGRVQRALLARSRGGVMNTTRRRLDGQAVQTIPTGELERRWVAHWIMGLLAFTVLATVLPARISYSADGDAADQMHEVTWLHESPNEVRSFVLFVSPVSGSTTGARQIDVGKPGGSGSGSAQFFSAIVPISSDDFVAVAAIGQNGLLSAVSAWSRPQPSQPGQPLVVQP
jgi:hypothetical protein